MMIEKTQVHQGFFTYISAAWNYLPRARSRLGSQGKPLAIWKFTNFLKFEFEVFSRTVQDNRDFIEEIA